MARQSPVRTLGKVLRSWIQSVSPDGTYSESATPPEECTKHPTVTFAPAVILRQRTPRSQVQCFATIAEQIRNGDSIPSGVNLLCEVSENGDDLDYHEAEVKKPKVRDETLYLPLPVNDEQIQIVHQIDTRRGIVVQGPPGTGKSHTIANLICHLLAKNKRVLVTSQTPRELRVLKDKLPKEIADLCVVLLGNDHAARGELEGSVQGINQRYSEWDPIRSQQEIKSLESHLFEVQKKIANTNRLIRELREIESYQHQVADGVYAGTAQQIACRVREEEHRSGWLTDDLAEADSCPLSSTEFAELVQLHRDLTEDYCNELKQVLVKREHLPDVAHFLRTIRDETEAKRNLEARASQRQSLRFRAPEQVPEEKLQLLRESISALIAEVGGIKKRFPWIPQATTDILSDNDTPWKQLRDFMKTHLQGLRDKAIVVQTVQVDLPASLDRKKLQADAHDLLVHLEEGKGLGLGPIAPKVVKRTSYIKKQVRINGRECSKPEDLRLLAAYLDANDEVEQLWSVWEGTDKRNKGSLLVQVGYLEERLEALESVIELERHMNTAKVNVKAIDDLAEPQWQRMEELEEMILDIEALEAVCTFKRVSAIVGDAIQKVRMAQASPKAHRLNQEFLRALEERDAQVLGRCFDDLDTIERDRERLSRRSSLQKRLAKAAPQIAKQLQDTATDQIWNERAKAWEAAWSWKQADEWLARFNKEHNKSKLETDLERLSEDQRRTIAKLAASKAWENCLENLTEHQRTNLVAWAMTMKRIGKGTGKRAPMYRRQAQQFMDQCKKAIPAWIMPLHRVFETVRPEPEAFDVIIIDEASQTGPEGLVIQYLAKQCIVVGDAEQISPEAVGTDRSAVDAVIKRYLHDVPFQTLYDPETSLFHHATMRFAGRVVLREHFRCMPEIIQFSNDLCYSSTPLKPLRQYAPNRLEPILVRYVKDGLREGSGGRALNRPEADALVDTLLQFCSQKQYANKTIGVISLQGEDQAGYIESKLLIRMTPAELEKRRVVCGDAYAFQGDERDVIFLSMVAAPNERIGALVRESDKRRFNVAASRAKDQVVLFHTATPNDLNPECMRYKILKYYLNPVRPPREVNMDLCESQFERDVYESIAKRGYRVFPQHKVAEYRIDLVVEGTKAQLAVECDGDEWHGIEQYERDVARQRILERSGWRFWRIRGCEYYRNPEGSLESLWETLSEMGIHPQGQSESSNDNLPESDGSITLDAEGGPQSDDHIGPLNASSEGGKEGLAQAALPWGNTLEQEPMQKSEPSGSPPAAAGGPIHTYPPEYFFRLARWARESGKLQPKQRHLIFDIGKYRARNWPLSEKQERAALRIVKEAIEAGFSEREEATQPSIPETDTQNHAPPMQLLADAPDEASAPTSDGLPPSEFDRGVRRVKSGVVSLPWWWIAGNNRPGRAGLISRGDRLIITAAGSDRGEWQVIRYKLGSALISLPREWLGNAEKVALTPFPGKNLEVIKLAD